MHDVQQTLPTHMLIYVNKTGQKTDKTFESMKCLIKVPIMYLSQAECEDTLMEIVRAKNRYNEIKRNHLEDEYVDEDEGLFGTLGIHDFNRSYLHTLILLDDIANSAMLAKSTSVMNSLMTQCAHINCSFFLATQFWKGLPTPIKSQVTTIYLYGGFSREQLRYILRQITLQNPFDVVWDEYKEQGYQDYMYIDIVESQYTIHKRVDGSDDDDDDNDDNGDDDSEEESESDDKQPTQTPQITPQQSMPYLPQNNSPFGYQRANDSPFYYYYY